MVPPGANTQRALDTLPQVLLVDDDEIATQALIRSLVRQGAEAEFLTATTPEAALEIVSTQRPQVVIVDLSLDPDEGPQSGLALLGELLSAEPTIRALVLTGHGAEEWGLQALQHGAASFLTKPVDPAHLLAVVRDSISFAELKRRYDELSSQPGQIESQTGLRSRNNEMQRAIESVAFAASHAQPVLLVGETGVGKGVIAHAIHRGSHRSGPFIRYQPSYGGSDLVTSELFGHQRGAFTGATENRSGLIEEADNGTLFIDEVDELPHETQVLLLNVLQEKQFRRLGSNRVLRSNFRLITATNRPLEELLSAEKLRHDFYHRVAHLTIEIPPLAKRREDIVDLAEEFLRNVVNRERLAVVGFREEALSRLMSYSWPGNVRELEAVVEGAVLRANFYERRLVEVIDLGIANKKNLQSSPMMSFRERVRIFELQLVKEALAKNQNNQSQAAASLKLDRTVLRRILSREK